jgi:hypothetical protein
MANMASSLLGQNNLFYPKKEKDFTTELTESTEFLGKNHEGSPQRARGALSFF